MTGQQSVNYPLALRMVMQENPSVNDMYSTGAVSEAAIRTIYEQWFK